MCLSTWVSASDPETWPIVYQDDFEDPRSDWLWWVEVPGVKVVYVDGTYEIQVRDGSAWGWISPWDREFLDFTVEVSFKFVEGTGEVGFIFRYVGWSF